MITVIDSGVSNIGSMQNMLRRLGIQFRVATVPEDVEVAQRIILPGVGSFDAGMANLHERGLAEVLTRKAMDDRVPVLGVCLGMQLMTNGSEEGELPGLGWVPARTVRFLPNDGSPKVPYMGWNDVSEAKQDPLIDQMRPDARFYFVHSYHVVCDNPGDVLLTARFGEMKYTAAFRRDNIYGAQFHPEKSHKFGMWLLKKFSEAVPS
jgi:glutamine amidotransferase